MGTILVIDDEPSTRVLFKSRLEDLGHRASLAANGAEGLMAARSNEFDLFLVDIGLGSGVDGFEVCRRLKAVPQTNGVPVVLISGQSTTREDLHRGYNAGCESFLMKGNMTLLEDVLRAMLRIKSLKDDLAVQNYLLERQNRRLQEEMRQRPVGAAEASEAEAQGLERPVGLMLVGHDGLVMHADRGARDLFGAGLEGKNLGVLAPSRGLEAFVRDARIESRSGFRLDLPARAGRASRSLMVSVTPTMPRGGSDLGALRAVSFFDASRGSSAGALAVSRDSNYDLPLVEAARRLYRPSSIVGPSLQTVHCRESVERALGGLSSVLLTGPEGVGKTFLARTLHFAGERSGRMVHLDAASLGSGSAERELFGSEKAPGLAQAADQGTLLISNIECLSAECQATLVGLVERGELEVGGKLQRLSLRLVGSSRQSAEALTTGGDLDPAFLALFGAHRIAVAPLVERPEDLGPLALEFARAASSGAVSLTAADLASLQDHDWPNNLRELEDCVEVLCAAALGDDSGIDSLPEALRARGGQDASRDRVQVLAGRDELQPMPRRESGDGPADQPVSLDLYERMALERALDEAGGDKLEAARLLAVGKSTLYRKLKKHGMS